MSKPRITSDSPYAAPRWLQSWWARYLYALIPVAVAALVEMPFGRLSDGSVQMLILFLGILAGSVFGGLGPGLVGTALAAGSAYLFLLPDEAHAPALRLLVAQGVLLSVVGGLLRTTRRRADAVWRANRELERQVLEISDAERSRIGHDLHDGLGQHLTGISLLTESLAQRIAAGAQPTAADIEPITQLAGEAVARTRDLARSLSPVALEQDGLMVGLEELAAHVSTLLKVRCECDFQTNAVQLDTRKSLHLYRIAQEAASNSVRHGKAKNVWIGLQRSGDSLILTVRDDGSGLSAKTTRNPGMGLRIMEYRARMVGAQLTIERAAPEGGTVVTCICRANARPEE